MKKTFRKMAKSRDGALIISLLLINLLVCNVVSISNHFESQEDEIQHSSHLPLQPELVRVFNNCHKHADTFDLCIRNAFNELRVHFKTGEYLFVWISFS